MRYYLGKKKLLDHNQIKLTVNARPLSRLPKKFMKHLYKSKFVFAPAEIKPPKIIISK